MALSELHLVNEAFGKVLRRYRAELGLSQEAMGHLLGVGQRTLSAIEKGERGLLAAEVVVFADILAGRLPYEAHEIRQEFFEGRHLAALPRGATHKE